MKLASFVFLLLFASRALAFDGDEHRYIARAGFALAVSACKADRECVLTPEQRLQVAEFENLHSRLDYGTLVSSVDYRLNPLQLMQKYGQQEQLPSSGSDLDTRLIQLLTGSVTAFFRAAAANDTHFQGELVAGIRNWHAYAVAIASNTEPVQSATGTSHPEPNLFAALLINSIADHYLHDFFAPGHIITPRFGLNDAVALSMHNRYNTLGAFFEITPKTFETDLQPLLEYLPPSESDGGREELIKVLNNNCRVPLWGDSELSQSPSQKVLMILIEARSVLDVLQSAHGKPHNSFLRTAWEPMKMYMEGKHEKFDLASAALPYGTYINYMNNGKPPNSGPVLALSFGSEMLLGVADKRLRQQKVTTARTVYAAEMLVWGHLPIDADRPAVDVAQRVPVYFNEYKQFGLNVGWVYARNTTEQARGIIVRAVLALPLLHSQVSLDTSEKHYDYKDQSGRRTAYGIRLQSGFSMLLFDLGLEREWTYGLRGSLKAERALRFGATIVSPLSNIPYLRSIERGFYRHQRDVKAQKYNAEH